jgi:thimet oligopeptidase
MKKNLRVASTFSLVIAPVFLSGFLGAGCSGNPVRLPSSFAPPVIRSDYAPGEITRLCDDSIARAKKAFDEIGALSSGRQVPHDIERTLLAFEEAGADFMDETSALTFMKQVSTNESMIKESADCEEKVSQFMVVISTRKDLYQAIKPQTARNADERRLLTETIRQFEISGLKLSDAKLAKVKELKSKLSTLENQFATYLNGDTSTVAFTEAEMTGATPNFLGRLKKDSEGRYIVTTKEPDYVEFMRNVKSGESRKRMAIAYNRRAADKNIAILEEAIQVRRQIASVMGYKTWADYHLQDRMAKDSATVMKFLNGLRDKLKKKNRADLAKLLAFKKEQEPSATRVDAWDVPYLEYQLKKRDYTLDNEEIRKYFPTDLVVQAMFEVYSEMLSVKFAEVKNAKVWADGVKQFEVRDAKSGEAIAYFYTDFFPRPLKYGHAAAFGLTTGRKRSDGTYLPPVAAIVANLSPPGNGLPSLLTHEDVETLFHEFGHIMHNTLTRSPYASLAGTNVARDFVEAPSQMLENWVWDNAILKRVSGHYQDHSKKLPDSLLSKMMEARYFNKGYFYTRQLVFGMLDMTYHTARGPVDASAVYDKLFREVQGLEPIPTGKFPASFGHLMGGYDAGYYGYLWSEVYAQDMFTRFKSAGLTSAEVGAQYRHSILEKGNMAPAMDLLREFLGREPNSDAFFEELGIKN